MTAHSMPDKYVAEDPERLETITADSKGRVSLGPEYAGRDVRVLVVRVEDEDAESD